MVGNDGDDQTAILPLEHAGNAMSVSMNSVNLRAFDSVENGRANRAKAGLFPAEEAALQAVPQAVRHGRVLELGVGTGRLVSTLADPAATYLGVDYAAQAIQEAQRAFPDVAFRRVDARDMPDLAVDAFDFAVFSYNGLDYVDHEGRCQALAEIARVLRPGGYFLFSFHNRDFRDLDRTLEPRPIPLWERVLFFWQAGARRRRDALRGELAKGCRATSDYAILNDSGMNYALLTYYSDLAAQTALLARMGLEVEAAYAIDGRRIDPGEVFEDDYMVHVLCRKS